MAITMDLTPFEAKTFGAWVQETPEGVLEAIQKYALWNRKDLVDQLKFKLTEAGKANLFPAMLPVTLHRNIGGLEEVPARLQVPRRPLANPRNLILHRRSVAAFLSADPGHAFTGIAMAGHVTLDEKVTTTATHRTRTTRQIGRPKIFLCPVRQGEVTTGRTSKGYVPKAFPDDVTTGVYQSTMVGAIMHRQSQAVVGEHGRVTLMDGGEPSHTILSSIVKLKKQYQALDQKDGHFVGFTVSKGVPGGNWKNRYSTTSASSNAGAFAGPSDHEDVSKYPSVEWRDDIMRACDAILEFEVDLRSKGLDIRQACEKLLQFKAKENEFWQSVRNQYWPCFDTTLAQVEEIDQEWD